MIKQFWRPASEAAVAKHPEWYIAVTLKNGRVAHKLDPNRVVESKDKKPARAIKSASSQKKEGSNVSSTPKKPVKRGRKTGTKDSIKRKRRTKAELIEAVKKNPKLADKFKSIKKEVAKLRESGVLDKIKESVSESNINEAAPKKYEALGMTEEVATKIDSIKNLADKSNETPMDESDKVNEVSPNEKTMNAIRNNPKWEQRFESIKKAITNSPKLEHKFKSIKKEVAKLGVSGALDKIKESMAERQKITNEASMMETGGIKKPVQAADRQKAINDIVMAGKGAKKPTKATDRQKAINDTIIADERTYEGVNLPDSMKKGNSSKIKEATGLFEKENEDVSKLNEKPMGLTDRQKIIKDAVTSGKSVYKALGGRDGKQMTDEEHNYMSELDEERRALRKQKNLKTAKTDNTTEINIGVGNRKTPFNAAELVFGNAVFNSITVGSTKRTPDALYKYISKKHNISKNKFDSLLSKLTKAGVVSIRRDGQVGAWNSLKGAYNALREASFEVEREVDLGNRVEDDINEKHIR